MGFFLVYLGRQPTDGKQAEEGKGSSLAAAIKQRQVVDPGQVLHPAEGATQAFDRGQVFLGVLFDLQGAIQQVRMVLAQPEDLLPLARRAEVAGALDRYWQP